MKLIIGLGNIGKEYEKTRHNIGFMAVDYIANELNIEFKLETKLKCFLGAKIINDEKIILIKPTTYMNSSGDAIRQVMSYYKIDIKDIIVIYDDLDIEKGLYKIKAKGSSGGHNGIKSIISQLSTEKFNRIKIGIKKEKKEIPTKNYVLGKFTNDELASINIVIENTNNIIKCFIKDNDIFELMNQFN